MLCKSNCPIDIVRYIEFWAVRISDGFFVIRGILGVLCYFPVSVLPPHNRLRFFTACDYAKVVVLSVCGHYDDK